MKKITILFDFLADHGGIQRVMDFQAKVLSEAGYDISLGFAYVNQNNVKQQFGDYKIIEYSKLPIKNETLQICSSIVSKNSVNYFKNSDLIISHSFPASFLALRLKKKFNIPYILHLHHPPQFLYNTNFHWALNSVKRFVSYLLGKSVGMIIKRMDKTCVKNADHHIVVGKTVRRIINNTYGVNGEIVYPAVHKNLGIAEYNNDDLKRLGVYKDYILCSGRIVRQKRFDYLIEAVSKLKYFDMQIVFAGDYNKTINNELNKLAKEKNVRNLVFCGWQDINTLKILYNHAKLTVLTCPKEWFGLVPIEAMSCGCPVVAWKDDSGPEEYIKDGINGYLADSYDISHFAECIKKAIITEWDKYKISESVQQFSEKLISKKVVEEINKLFNKV